jgi:Lrp/AsnC family leucine-responsive transcriptional regulator
MPTRPNHPLDRTDWHILRLLQDNARLSNVELAQKINLTPSPTLSRVKALEDRGVIQRYVTLLDPQELGLHMSVFIRVTLDKQTKKNQETFESAVRDFPEVMECFSMSGDSDYLLRVMVAGMPELEHFVLDKLIKLAEIANIRSSLALKQVKYQTALPLPAPAGRAAKGAR